MYLLFPGRHQLLTNFQFNYLNRIAQEGLALEKDANERPLSILSKIEAIVFAVTSANHSNTRRNPLPFHQRVMQIEDFVDDLPVPTYTFGVDEVGHLDNFASYTIKRINHESEGLFQLSPENTVVVCSTPVMSMYEKLGYKILPAELLDRAKQTFSTEMPWDLVEIIAFSEDNALYKKCTLLRSIFGKNIASEKRCNYFSTTTSSATMVTSQLPEITTATSDKWMRLQN
jgi:hypothetical protein